MKSLTLSVPNDFWKEEERCDYKVSKEMKQIWAVELDLLHMFDTVCKKHQLRYFASDGTLLGAIRHHGFIPWDDDIDIAMLREDYDKLCKIGPAEFKHPYFFQSLGIATCLQAILFQAFFLTNIVLAHPCTRTRHNSGVSSSLFLISQVIFLVHPH